MFVSLRKWFKRRKSLENHQLESKRVSKPHTNEIGLFSRNLRNGCPRRPNELRNCSVQSFMVEPGIGKSTLCSKFLLKVLTVYKTLYVSVWGKPKWIKCAERITNSDNCYGLYWNKTLQNIFKQI
jgi:hypothetical protein